MPSASPAREPMNAVKLPQKSTTMSHCGPFTDETEWIEQIRRGNESAFETLFREYHDDLVDFAQLQLHSAEVAEEIVQDIFLSIWKRGASWQPRGSLKAYLYGAVRNKIIDHRRHRRSVRRWKREAKRESDMVREGPEEAYQVRELQQAVQKAIEDLPERRRLIFKLSREHQLSYAEIATLLDLSINTVENQIVRGIKTLRNRLLPYLKGRHQSRDLNDWQ